jgi:hypothetical protein
MCYVVYFLQVRFEAAASLASKAFSSEEVQVRLGLRRQQSTAGYAAAFVGMLVYGTLKCHQQYMNNRTWSSSAAQA